jgi:hypothetical protein
MSRYPSALTTVEAVGRQLKKADPAAALTPQQAQYDDFYDYMSDIVPQVSDYITGQCERSFVPYKEDKTLYFSDLSRDGLYDSLRRFLWLPDELLVVSSVTWNGTALAATDYRLITDDGAAARGMTFNSSPSVPLAWSSAFNDGIIISGIWGCHDNISVMWSTVDSSVTIANSTTTTITVAASVSYEIWQYLRCESEYMQVIDKPTSTTITVIRGVNGTTAAAHTSQPLQAYVPVKDIRMAATRMAAFMYEKRTDVGGTVQIGEASFRLDEMPPAVKEAINRRRKWSFGHI